MNRKVSIRSASDYEESVSSKSSCRDSIITIMELSGGHSQCSSIFAYHQCQTPTKNFEKENDHTYSLKKLQPRIVHWQDEIGQDSNQGKNWIHESEDSRVRKRQNTNSDDKTKCKKFLQHIKALKFQEELTIPQLDKQNQPVKLNFNQSSSEDQQNEILPQQGKRKVGNILYSHRIPQIGGLDLIWEEDAQISGNTEKKYD